MQKSKEEHNKDKHQLRSAKLQSEAASSITTKQEMRLHGEFGPPGVWGWGLNEDIPITNSDMSIMAPSPKVSLLKLEWQHCGVLHEGGGAVKLHPLLLLHFVMAPPWRSVGWITPVLSRLCSVLGWPPLLGGLSHHLCLTLLSGFSFFFFFFFTGE